MADQTIICPHCGSKLANLAVLTDLEDFPAPALPCPFCRGPIYIKAMIKGEYNEFRGCGLLIVLVLAAIGLLIAGVTLLPRLAGY